MTFTKDDRQLEAAKRIPSDRLVLETDCPFLTPAPLRGTRNEPANVALTAKFLAGLRGEAYEDLAYRTTKNAEELFGI
jgi:TatD DNase family protein